MRNSDFLDNERPEDSKIGELQHDKDGNPFRIINGKKIIQFEVKTQRDKDLALIINRVRASRMKPQEYFKSLEGKPQHPYKQH